MDARLYAQIDRMSHSVNHFSLELISSMVNRVVYTQILDYICKYCKFAFIAHPHASTSSNWKHKLSSSLQCKILFVDYDFI